ncbi:hypothetical protein [Aeropyrum camini]|uniref:hypothetical protein n=1 Tax=Aeropyrum camini TaxID=229980 RepID=UPI0007878855|nr:hypothetical protein [Aeropyrum camini]
MKPASPHKSYPVDRRRLSTPQPRDAPRREEGSEGLTLIRLPHKAYATKLAYRRAKKIAKSWRGPSRFGAWNHQLRRPTL